jgi:hypothetical protein
VTALPVTPAAGPDGGGERLPWRTTISGAFVLTLLRPLSWVLGLAGFLAGGGLILVAWPILVLPTPTGLQNALGGPVSSLVFGDPAPLLIAVIAGGAAAFLVLVIGGTYAGAWAERQGIAVTLDAAADEGLGLASSPSPLAGAPGTGGVAVLRLLALMPVLAAAVLAWQPVYDAAYRELILPRDLVTPVPLRVVGDVPWLLAGIAVVWLLSDAAAAVGVRRLVLEQRSLSSAWLQGWVDLVRRPQRILPTAVTGVMVLVLVAGPALAAAALGWARVREILAGDQGPAVAAGAVAVWVAVWLGALVLAGVASAVRAAAWTLEVPRRASPGATSNAPSPD